MDEKPWAGRAAGKEAREGRVEWRDRAGQATGKEQLGGARGDGTRGGRGAAGRVRSGGRRA